MLVSPLRYPGGKAKLYKYFAALIKENRLLGCHYCEPYAGGAGLALQLLSSGLVDHIYLNDIDEAIWAFWVSALENNRELVAMIKHAKLDIEEWRKQRNIWQAKDLNDPLKLGFATFYLNRTNRSGIIEGAGPVGGYAQNGFWRLDARFDAEKQAACVASLAPFRARVTLTQIDALIFVGEKLQQENMLIYLDPPYYIKGSKLYRNFYVHEDHLAVKDLVCGRPDARWVVSYDAVQAIRDIYSEITPTVYSLTYSAGSNTKGKELIYLSDALQQPDVRGFLRESETITPAASP